LIVLSCANRFDTTFCDTIKEQGCTNIAIP
jgi:hypothetical protein